MACGDGFRRTGWQNPAMSAARPRMHEAIQAVASADAGLEGSVLLGWVVIAEWMTPNDSRWLSCLDGTASGAGCPDWQRAGYLHDALFSPDAFTTSDESEDEDA